MPKPLLDKLLAARNFNQGFATVEFLASALDRHGFPCPGAPGMRSRRRCRRATLARIGMPDEIAPRHAAPHFGHVFGGDGYSAGYYAYLWSEVLDADGFGAFEEAQIPSIPPPRSGFTRISIPPAARAISPQPIALSAAAIPISRRCWKAADFGARRMKKLALAVLLLAAPALGGRAARPSLSIATLQQLPVVTDAAL